MVNWTNEKVMTHVLARIPMDLHDDVRAYAAAYALNVLDQSGVKNKEIIDVVAGDVIHWIGG